jgi:hypothetical protein
MGKRIVTTRELLLVEVERWCGDHACNARTRLSLTKAEARDYTGFECSRCGRWNDDALSERDIPEWWEGLKVASPEGLRMGDARKGPGVSGEPEDEGGEGVESF